MIAEFEMPDDHATPCAGGAFQSGTPAVVETTHDLVVRAA
jgi:hypothetical protein